MDSYYDLTQNFFGTDIPRDLRNAKLASIYDQDSKWFKKCYEVLVKIEYEYIQELIVDLAKKGVPGDFAEFGIFQGAWINRLYHMAKHAELDERRIYGLDSFKGLSRPHETFDVDFWKEGMYAASREDVEAQLKVNERPQIKLIEGFFEDSLKTREAQNIGQIAFARIDCDIYEPAKDCLNFLSDRLSHNAILVFDDWTHSYEYGEGKAFAEWHATVPNLKFEFIFMGPWDHLHLRVLHKDKI